MTLVHVYAPQPDTKAIHATVCPDCGKRTRMISFHVPWHGWDSTCIKCGRNWQDGEWMALDFVRGSRQKSIANAKRRFRAMAAVGVGVG